MGYYQDIFCHICRREVCQDCGSCHEDHGEEDKENV